MEEKDDYLPGAHTPDYLARAIDFFHNKSFNQALGEHVSAHAYLFVEAAEVNSFFSPICMY
jgi:hypothetical protein